MIKLREAELVSLLPPYIKENADVQAISYAFKLGMEKFLQYVQLSILYGAIDVLPGQFIDLLALELQSQYYDESLELDIKREIVRNSLAWYSKGGTVSAVEELISVLFGKGALEEWFQFGGKPGTFRIKLHMEDQDAEIDIRDIVKKIKSYKKLSAHFAAIVIGYYFGVPILCENATICLQMSFYPQFNRPELFLDNTWNLNGAMELSGYCMDGRVDLYPVEIKLLATARAAPKEETGIVFLSGAEGSVSSSQQTGMCVPAMCREAAKESIVVQAEAEVDAGGGAVLMDNLNCLDDEWKLDGGRELNGGTYWL